jgi:hypothetical protein
MIKMAKWLSLTMVAICALAPAIVPSTAFGQGAEDEYNLELPGSGANSDTPSGSGASNVSDSSDSGGLPVIVIVLVVGAGVAVGVAVWRLRKPGPPDEPPGREQPSSGS